MSEEKDEPRADSAREEFERARERYYEARNRERAARRDERLQARDERQRARDERRGMSDEIRRTMRASIRGGLGRSIRDSMNFNFDLGDLADLGGDEYSEVVERDFTVSGMPWLHVRNVSGDTKVMVGPADSVHVTARKRVRGTSEERAKRLLENVEVRMEQDGDDIILKPHLYEQDRGWADLFRGGRVAVDFDITVPREVRLEAATVSGDLVVEGTRGPIDAQSVSGDVRLDDVQGPLRLKTVSGDGAVNNFAGQLISNSVSGDLDFEHVRLNGSDVVTVSGEVRIDGELDRSREHRVKTISGDVELRLSGGSYDIRFKSVSGDLQSQVGGEVDASGRRDKHVIIGAAEAKVTVKTMSGDLELHTSSGGAPEASAAAGAAAEPMDDVERTEPMTTPADPATTVDVRDLLARVARGELDVDAAAAELDARRGR
jgi:hypothetical protein